MKRTLPGVSVAFAVSTAPRAAFLQYEGEGSTFSASGQEGPSTPMASAG